jgi:predicted Zn-dependent protease
VQRHVAAIALFVAIGCATNPATGRRQLILMSESQEVQIGRESDAEIRKEMGVYADENLQRYVSDLGRRLATRAHRPQLPWTFAVLDEAAVNAFALPGGFIYITRGILPFLRNEAELAGVIGHEIGHVDARHSAEAYSRQLGLGVGLAAAGVFSPGTQPLQNVAGAGLGVFFLKYGRDAEVESDRLGVGYAAASGWDPRGVPGMLSTLGRLDAAAGSRRGIPNWALTHPPAADRVARVQEAITAAPAATTTNPAAVERFLDGLVFGDSREKGIVRGADFLHPILRFAVTFPNGWDIINTNEQVLSRPGEEANAVLLLELATGEGSVQQVAAAQMGKAGLTLVEGARTSINGLEAFLGTYQGTTNNTAITLQAAHLRSGAQTYVVAGMAPTSSYQSVSGTFAAAIRSFRALSQAEADRIQSSRVDFYTARAGDTWESIAKAGGAGVRAATLAIMNGREPNEQPRVGDRLRIVVGG